MENLNKTPDIDENTTKNSSENQENRKANQDIGKKIRKTVSLNPKVIMDEFTDYYPQKEINSDKKYISATEARISNTEDPIEKNRAKMFEDMFIAGALVGGWLGSPSANGVNVAAAPTCKYDDYRHKIDAFATFYYKSEETGKTRRSTIGIDVTTSGSKKVIMEKLTHSSNDNIERPFGFSKLKYFTNGVDRQSIENLPRYVIGVSNYDVRDIEQTTRINNTTGMLDFGLNNFKNLANRYKVLSEMYVENQLYLAMEPKEINTEEQKKVHKKLTIMDKRLKQALIMAAKGVASNQYFNIPKNLDDDKLISAVESRLIAKSNQYFKDEQEEKRLKNPSRFSNSEDYNDTYVQILSCARELMRKSGHHIL